MPYHITPSTNLVRIMQEGLKPQIGARAVLMEQEDGIYLFKTLEDASDALTNWLGELFDDVFQLALLEVTIPPNARTIPTTADYEIIVADPIPPKFIRVLYQDLDEASI